MLKASCLTLEINEFRCYEAKIEVSKKNQQSPGVEPRTPLASAASALNSFPPISFLPQKLLAIRY